MRRLVYFVASPFILLGEMAAAAGDVVRGFPTEFRDRWRALGASAPVWPEDAETMSLRPADAGVMTGSAELRWFAAMEPTQRQKCAHCGGSGFEPDLKNLDEDPACSTCDGDGKVEAPSGLLPVISEEDRRRSLMTPNSEALRQAVEAMERRKRGQ